MTDDKWAEKTVELQRQELTEEQLVVLRQKHNPTNQPVGHFTGRCATCHSKDLWDDATCYGCNCCGAIFFTGDLMPRLIPNGSPKCKGMECEHQGG